MSVTETSRTSSVLSWSREVGRPTAVAVSVTAALVVNLALWLIGLAAGGSFAHTNAGVTQSAAPGGVVLMTVVPLTLGLGVAALLSRWWAGFIRVAQIVGAALPLATIAGTLDADFDGASTVTLALMHVVIATVAVVGLEKMRADR
ncbi:DUF6069 family protein [Rhodococcus chondri]|uniref:DUF6069 family protein n=1 Tax=Rhodococcus chondri TaxID=3065941 RepID=A0ABU7JY39_9NOCA|nr:DUF6069 family protein [Rhodococcus sp. CC-R104]MEE2034810.1 DUF6069 family protein [Rhodococcus sp. CC-R104]